MKQVTQAGTCPKCGGGSFVAKRTKKGVVAAGLLAPKRVRCVRCGESLQLGSVKEAPKRRGLSEAQKAQKIERYGRVYPLTPWGWFKRVRDVNRLGRAPKGDRQGGMR